jgi:hypothetical protein
MFQASFDAVEALFDVARANLNTVDTTFYTLDFRFQQIAQVIEAPVDGIAQIVDTPILKINPEQVPGDDDSHRPPLVNDWSHCFSGSSASLARKLSEAAPATVS